MVSTPPSVKKNRGEWKKFLFQELNFYRLHLIVFTLSPLFFSIIFYASNGRYKISYIDSLFNCVSAMMVCGLATVDLSSLTPWQQVILFIQMCVGSPILVSWVVVMIRRRYIRTRCSRAFTDFMAKRDEDAEKRSFLNRLFHFLGLPSPISSHAWDEEQSSDRNGRSRAGTPQRLRPDMIRRMDDRPVLVNPSGLVTGATPEIKVTGATPGDSTTQLPLGRLSMPDHDEKTGGGQGAFPQTARESIPPSLDPSPISQYNPGFPRTMTVEFATDLPRPSDRPRLRAVPTIGEQTTTSDADRASRHFPTSVSLNQYPTAHSGRTHRSLHSSAKHQGYGGFPMPHTIARKIFRKAFPEFNRKLTRTITIPVTNSLVSASTSKRGEKHASYIRDHLRIGRNSQFDTLSMTKDDLMDIAYLEYQGLGLLLWAIALYHFGSQLLGFAIMAPYMSIPKWHEDLIPPQLVRPVHATWFSLFQAVSSYTNTGMSLVDQSMIPFQKAYPTIVVMIFLILAGNTCFPIFMRFSLWILNRCSRSGTDLEKVSAFLLDHPRRCFLYLFPSHQTWLLLLIVLTLTLTDWVFFLILDLNNQAIGAIPTGVRVLAGLMQGIAVRAAGFGIVPLAALAPAVKVLYTIMMYIAVYPIALSVRSTNVHEEKSLGVYHETDEEKEEDEFNSDGPRMQAWSRYVWMHARQQLAFDMWWMALSLFVVCIAESKNINDPEKYGWFNIFNILFELVSAYGTVGLSLGLPTANYSFSGAFTTISKLVVCAVMIRGRHRGLPVAIDRAVMFPREYRNPEDDSEQEEHESDTNSDSQDDRTTAQMASGRVLSIITEPVHGVGFDRRAYRRSLYRKSQQSMKATETIGDRTISSGPPLDLSEISSRLEDIQDQSEISVNAWRHNIEKAKSQASVDTLPGEQSSNASFHRSDTSSSHREVE